MEKIMMALVAAILTNAATCATGGNAMVISPDLSDPNARAKNLQVWETFNVFYSGLVKNMTNPAVFAEPNLGVGKNVAAALGEILPGLLGGPAGVAIKAAIGVAGPVLGNFAGPLVNPGSAPATAGS